MDITIDEFKIDCPCCGSKNCFEEKYTVAENSVKSYLCMGCGYSTTTLFANDSDPVKEFEDNCPELFKDIKFVDKQTNLVWYPTVLNFPDKGIVFPDGTNAFDWQWRAVPIIPIADDEKESYPVPGKEGEYYKTKADMEASKLYPQTSFNEACKHVKIIVE